MVAHLDYLNFTSNNTISNLSTLILQDYEQVEKEITDKTVALFIEPISNPQMIAIDVKPYYQLCKAKGLLSIIDNTF